MLSSIGSRVGALVADGVYVSAFALLAVLYGPVVAAIAFVLVAGVCASLYFKAGA